MSAPQVSVLIIAHNRAHTIAAAVRSVLAQTFTDFELVVVDDGSTDGTVAVVEGIADPRLRLVRSPANEGIPGARNRALGEARGEFVAWLDSDDLCHPSRLALQHDMLRSRPDLAMIGSAARKIRLDGRLMAGGRVPVRGHDEIRALLLFRSAFQQSSIFGRTEALRDVPYDPAFPVCEDVDMFVRFTERHRAENLALFLIARRIHPGQTIRSNVEPILDRQMEISGRLLDRLELDYHPEELRRHVILGGSLDDQMSDWMIDWAEGWFERILDANARRGIYRQAALRTCFDRIVMKAALRQYGKNPAKVGRLARHAVNHAGGAFLLARDATLLPLTGRPSAAGLRPHLKA